MGIFNKKKSFEVVDQPANYNTALDYLIGLGADEYAKVVKIAEEYRKTNAVAAGILGVKNEPTTFIHEPTYTGGKTLAEYELKYEQLPKKPKASKKSKK